MKIYSSFLDLTLIGFCWLLHCWPWNDYLVLSLSWWDGICKFYLSCLSFPSLFCSSLLSPVIYLQPLCEVYFLKTQTRDISAIKFYNLHKITTLPSHLPISPLSPLQKRERKQQNKNLKRLQGPMELGNKYFCPLNFVNLSRFMTKQQVLT